MNLETLNKIMHPIKKAKHSHPITLSLHHLIRICGMSDKSLAFHFKNGIAGIA